MNQVPGMIRRNITYKEKSLIVHLNNAIVRPHLAYCTGMGDIQMRATILISGLRDLRCEERLKEYGLAILETRIFRGSNISVYVIKWF